MSPTDRRLIVNADDFGLSDRVNQAVASAHRDGALSSASLLVNAPATAAAVRLAAALPGLGIGLHLALTELAPLTTCPALAPGGRFPPHHQQVFRRLLAEQVPRTEIAAEVRAQFAAARDSGLRIDHVDGHGHVHLLPGVLEAVVAACAEFGVPALRWPVEPAWEPPGLTPGLGARLKRWLLRRLAQRGEPLVAGLARPAAFFGLAASGRVDQHLLLALAVTPWAGVAELMVHPTTVDQAEYPAYCGARELAALTSAAVAAALPPRVTFRELPAPGPVARP
ncbi:MAG: ChbG/HpnK family deacetylase [Fimbriimonadaceae bacterium]|nr:ChbG/HpnK family deacetylase [Fimbriimonadaceae bacterium]